jgi:hypothetical protein
LRIQYFERDLGNQLSVRAHPLSVERRQQQSASSPMVIVAQSHHGFRSEERLELRVKFAGRVKQLPVII